MKYITIIVVNFTLLALMIGLVQWFDAQKEKIALVNKNHYQQMIKLQKVSYINKKIQDQIIQNINKHPKSFNESAIKIVKFYDANSNNYNLVVKNYIYSDKNGENIDFSFNLNRDNMDLLRKFINLDYESGFLKFSELSMKQKDIIGVIQIIQPHNGKKDANISK